MTPFKHARVPESEITKVVNDIRAQATKQLPEFQKLCGLPTNATVEDVIVIMESRVRSEAGNKVYKNDLYQVSERVFAMDGEPCFHLSIKRIDRAPIHDWRHLQQIKNEIIGPEFEAIELYPAESRVVDTANQYHLWGFLTPGQRWPFGFNPVQSVRSENSLAGSVNRPFAK